MVKVSDCDSENTGSNPVIRPPAKEPHCEIVFGSMMNRKVVLSAPLVSYPM